MVTWTLIVMISAGYDFQKSPTALTSYIVPGFTTQQACNNAGNKVLDNRLPSYDWNQIRTKAICVVSDV